MKYKKLSVKRFIKKCLLYIFGLIVVILKFLRLIFKQEKSKKILILSFWGMGDSIQQTPIYFGLREKYSALVLTSQAEGFPMVVMQSLLRGLPIICPQKLSVYDDVVMEGINGYGYDESKSNNLMESIRKLKMLNKFSPNEIRADTLKRFGSKSYIQRFNNSINLLNHNSLK